jgi:uncharacterized protein YllA (UPF0747 family)
VTGQQAGLFTGPLLSVFKALTAVKLARELVRRGIDAVPVFWIASDDHDHEEVAWAGIVDQDSCFQRITTALGTPAAKPVAWLRYTDDISAALAECFTSLPPSQWHADIRAIVESVYRPGSSPVDAFARMLLRLFEGSGLVMADPMDPPLRRLATDVLETALERNDELRGAVIDRTRMIREAGYAGQVHVDEAFTGFFVLDGTSRLPLDRGRTGGVSAAELSPNVLLRPVVQDSVFPTAAYVAGPAEIAYLAQAGAAYECLGRRMPPIVPRITATLVDPPMSRIMRKHGLGLGDVLGGSDNLRRRVMRNSADGTLFDEVERDVVDQIRRLGPLLEGADTTLVGALEHSIQKMTGQIDGLRSRFIAAETRRNRLLERQLASLEQRLFPEKKLQERAVNVTSFLVRYGMNLMTLIDERLALDGSVHQVVEL